MKLSVELETGATQIREGWASIIAPKAKAPPRNCLWRDQVGRKNLCALGQSDDTLQEVLVYGRFKPGVVLIGETLDDETYVDPGFHEHPSLRGQAAKLVPKIDGFTLQHGPVLESNTSGQQVWFMRWRCDADPGTWIFRWVYIRFMDPVVIVKWAAVYSNLDRGDWDIAQPITFTYDSEVVIRTLFRLVPPVAQGPGGPELPRMRFGAPWCGIDLLALEHDDVLEHHFALVNVWGMADKAEWAGGGWPPNLPMPVDRWPTGGVDEPWSARYRDGDGPLRQVDFPPGTGDRYCFGDGRGQAALALSPAAIEALHVANLNEFRRPTHFLERDGTELLRANHPDMWTLGTAPDPRFGSPPDRLGKSGDEPLTEMAPHDSSHIALLPAVGAYVLTMCPLILWILRAAVEQATAHVDPDPPGPWGPMNSSYGPPRGLGRIVEHMAIGAQLFHDKAAACKAKTVQAFKIYTAEIDLRPGEVRTLKPDNDPRLLLAIQGFELAWFPWQDAIAMGAGVYAAHRVFPETINDAMKEAFRKNATSMIREGFWRDPVGEIQANWIVGYRDGNPVGTQEFDTGFAADGTTVQRVWGGGGYLTLLTMGPAIQACAENIFGNLEPDVVARAKEILSFIDLNSHKAHGWLGVHRAVV